MRSGLWAALVVIAVIWIVAIGFEREPCKQVEMVAAAGAASHVGGAYC
jgi:hypothetical protein